MGRKSKFSPEIKELIVLDYLNGKKSVAQLCTDYDTGERIIFEWINKYRDKGIDAFIPMSRNNTYTKEFKNHVVLAYLNGEGSLEDLAIKYNVPAHSTIRSWVNKYNSHIELEDYDPHEEAYMAKSRKTTFEERKQAVDYCLDHNRNYAKAAEEFNVSYAMVYSWVQKFEKDGYDGLADRRGKHKLAQRPINDIERMKQEVELYKKLYEEEKLKNEILKKVKEIERSGALSVLGKKQNSKL
jgi:transposase-like protein